ncbi:MAG TPA: sigma-70 family RNA polymerase sigma factor [Polyangiaceae bacterium]|nr:sigma-70 family RNA polymerase sigma factor [Polyangiaceae bacterium]
MQNELDLTGANLCACGEEPVDRHLGLHAIGARCRERVVKHVRRRFGGRYVDEVEDIVQECFRLLLLPSGLASFEPSPERRRSDAFGAWLWRVVHRHCNSKAAYLRKLPEPLGDEFGDLPERGGGLTPEQGFARRRLRQLNDRAVAEVERHWRAKGPKWGERCDAVLSLLYEKQADTQQVCEQLGIDDGHLRVLKWKLSKAIKCAVRTQVREELRLDPESDPETIERETDGEIADLFQMAFPGREPRFAFWTAPTPEPEPAAESEPGSSDAQLEVTA